jgi:hypothetical protein
MNFLLKIRTFLSFLWPFNKRIKNYERTNSFEEKPQPSFEAVDPRVRYFNQLRINRPDGVVFFEEHTKSKSTQKSL